MRSRTVTAGFVVGLLAALAVALPGRAGPGVWSAAGDGVDLGVGLVANLNDPAVVAVGRGDGRVRLRRPADPAWTDLGTPADAAGRPLRPTRLATSGGKVFAATAGGVYAWAAPRTWTRIGEPAVDLLASRLGAYVTRPNEPTDFRPYLFAVDAAGRVSRFTGQGWAVIGASAGVGSLAESGMATGVPVRLFRLNADRGSVWQWDGSPGAWTRVAGPSESIAGGPKYLARTDPGTGGVEYYDATTGIWSGLAILPAAGPVSGAVPSIGPGGRYVFGPANPEGTTHYYLSPDRRTVHGVRAPSRLPAGGGTRGTWFRLAVGDVRQIVTQSGQGRQNDLFLLTGSGEVTLYAWPTVLTSGPYPQAGAVGAVYRKVYPAVTHWTGNLRIESYAGALPPGLIWTVQSDGRLAVQGEPTAAGTFDVQLLATDDSGATAVIDESVTIGPPGAPTGPPTDQPPVTPATSVRVVNCLAGTHPIPVYVRDVTAGTRFTPMPGSPAPPHTGSCVVTPGTPGPTMTVTDGRVYEFVVVDPSRPLCGGLDDPLTPACVVASGFYSGSAALGGPQSFVVGT